MRGVLRVRHLFFCFSLFFVDVLPANCVFRLVLRGSCSTGWQWRFLRSAWPTRPYAVSAGCGGSCVPPCLRGHMLRGRTRSLRCAQALAYILPLQIWHAPAAARFVPLPIYDVIVCPETL